MGLRQREVSDQLTLQLNQYNFALAFKVIDCYSHVNPFPTARPAASRLLPPNSASDLAPLSPRHPLSLSQTQRTV